MIPRFSISLKNRIALFYALFTCLALIVLTIIVNHFTHVIFNNLVMENIERRRMEIAAAIGDQYQPAGRRFNTANIAAMGMGYAEEGFYISLEDETGRRVWDSSGHGQRPHGMHGMRRPMGRMIRQSSMSRQQFPVHHGNRRIGTVNIETISPLFYSEAESRFISSVNNVFMITGLFFIALSIVISIILSGTIAQPILKAGRAARTIAHVFSRSTFSGKEHTTIRINDNYRTRELADLSRSINCLAEELEKRECRQNQLTGDIAHELRTPLTCLQGTIEAMLDGVYPPSREYLESCHQEIQRLTALIDDLDTLTALEWSSITLQKTEFDLVKMLRTIVKQWEGEARKKDIMLHMNTTAAAFLVADYDRLKQAFINLLSNAVKYTDHGTITISVEPAVEGPAQWMVSITDTGIGIPEDDLPHIFERFYRSDKSRSRTTGGTGIGLAIAAAIIAAHKGTITAENKKDISGSIFRVVV